MLSRLDGNKELLGELVEVFFQDYFQDLAKIKEYMEKMDSSALAFVVHSLKGELGNLGFTSAYTIASALEEMVKKNNFEKASLTLSELEKEIKWLENFFNPGWESLI